MNDLDRKLFSELYASELWEQWQEGIEGEDEDGNPMWIPNSELPGKLVKPVYSAGAPNGVEWVEI